MIPQKHFRLFIFSQLLATMIQSVPSEHTIPQCSDYTDTRKNQSELGTPITIPVQKYDYGLQFMMTNNQTLNCPEEKQKIREISWDTAEYLPRNFSDPESGSGDPYPFSYFTSAGYFYDNMTQTYYKPVGDYCVKSYSDDTIILKLCSVGTDCSNPSVPNTLCIPKCCAIDEVFLFWKRQCTRLPQTQGKTPWIPHIFQGPKYPHNKLDITPKDFNFRMTKFPRNCTFKYIDVNNETREVFNLFSASFVVHPKDKNKTQQDDRIKLVAPSGKSGDIRAMVYLKSPRRWTVMEKVSAFCVDGYFVKYHNAVYEGTAEHFIMLYCQEHDGMKKQDKNSVVNSWIYVVISVIALLFLLAIVIVYGALWEKQNLHGLTILTYTVSQLGGYLFLTMAHLIFLTESRDPEKQYSGIGVRGPICYGIAVLAHYFYISNLMWLTVMNFDLWLTFKTIRAAKRESKEWVKFGWYSLAGFGLPLGLIIAFVIVDEHYRNPESEVPVPDYATSSCFVSQDFRGQYLYIPMAILLGVNIILIALTMWIFIEARKQTNKRFSESAANANRYSAKLFAKLFIVMGGYTMVDFITWYYNDAGSKHWLIALLEGISYLSPVLLFVLFCLNDRVVNQMREKYPNFMKMLEPALRCFEKKAEGHTGSWGEHSSTSNKTAVTNSGTLDRRPEVKELDAFPHGDGVS